ncbi:hypothetical protein [Porphyromonas endodontalis]|uniref:hypothetical protein n=1 Tax=Porphyromonas endodontalis TaxID=28124 RepID=UPI0028EF05CD|nr:hypothetical protein [Porphyromonas endodontalis]
MKRSRLFWVASLLMMLPFSGEGFAQSVGVFTKTPDASAALDVDVSALPADAKKGMLLPRVQLTGKNDRITIPHPAVGLVVYNLQDSGSGDNQVEHDMFYFWDGTKWLDMTNIDIVIRELLPQVFFILQGDTQNVASKKKHPSLYYGEEVPLTYDEKSEVEKDGVVKIVDNITLNTGNNVRLNDAEDTFEILNPGDYEISGIIGYNPNIWDRFLELNTSTNLEFIIQRRSSQTGWQWKNIARCVSAWGNNTVLNSRHMVISPMVVKFEKGDKIRAVVKQTMGHKPGDDKKGQDPDWIANVNPAGGSNTSKVIKIQKLS